MFFNEMLKKLGLLQQSCGFCVINFAFEGICIKGRAKILHLSTTKIILLINKEKLFLYGNNLQLKSLDKTEINIIGQVVCTSKKEVLLNE